MGTFIFAGVMLALWKMYKEQRAEDAWFKKHPVEDFEKEIYPTDAHWLR